MSRNRYDRKPRRESWRSDYAGLTGGLAQSYSALAVKPGRLNQCLNMEEVFGQQGYSFVKGYERFSGRPSPSRATYSILRFDGGNTEIVVGDAIFGTGDTNAEVAQVVLESGSWADGDAAGYLVITLVAGTWVNDDEIKIGGTPYAYASDDLEAGTVGFQNHAEALRATQTYLRDQIEAPYGSGAVLGGAVFQGVIYCVRNAEDGLSATLWKSASYGWVEVATGLHPGGAYRFAAANFSGSADRLDLYFVSGRTRLTRLKSDGATIERADPIWGSEATSTTSLTVAAGPQTLTIVEAARNWQAGDELTLWKQEEASVFMAGYVTAYNSGTGQLDMEITDVQGAGTFDSWEVGKTDYSDKPFLLCPHKNHMFLAYRLGQLQASNIGDAMTYTTTAQLLGFGQELTGLTSLKGKALGVFGQDKIGVLEGSSATDWDLTDYTTNSGAILDTVQDNDGNPVFLNNRGVTTLQATQNFGDLEAGILSRDAKKSLDGRIGTSIGARMVQGSCQYRLYFTDGTNMRFTFTTGASLVGPKDVSPSISQYQHVPSCFFSGKINGQERMFFGTTDGFLMEEDAGTSYDGVAIFYAIRLPFNHYKSPSITKQFHKLELELTSPDAVTISFRQLFEYDNGEYEFGTGDIDLSGEGGQFDVSAWDTFAFDAPTVSRAETSIDGQGRNMALMLWAESDIARPVILQGVLTYYEHLGLVP